MHRRIGPALCILAALASPLVGQDTPVPRQLQVEPQRLILEVGSRANLEAVVRDSAGRVLDTTVVFYSLARQSASVSSAGEVAALRPGQHTIVVLVPKDPRDDPRSAESILRREIRVEVPSPPVERLRIAPPTRLLRGSTVLLEVDVIDRSGALRHDLPIRYSSSDERVATVDSWGQLSLHSVGTALVLAAVGDVSAQLDVTVEENPVREIELLSSVDQARTGDVVRFNARALDTEGEQVHSVTIGFSVSSKVNPAVVAPGATASIDQDGNLVAERSGLVTVVATVGSVSRTKTISIVPRGIHKKFEAVGHGAVRDRHTSDLWVWRGQDGSHYAITGTWGADGHAYVWDVSDPQSIRLVDAVKVDARTVNDVKVSADGKIAVISREGASNRKNGIVILDVSEPRVGVRVLATYDDQLSGGVHNLFLYEDHAYVVNNSRRLDVINLADPSKPYRVGQFTLDTPGHAVHDVWVVDGVAFTSNWNDGVVALDVGGGDLGGSPRQPKILGRYAYPNGWNHAAFPYRSPSTGKFYVFAGDEAFPYSRLRTGKNAIPNRAAGWIHVIEWESWDSPREVARYQVPEAGSHNFWIEDEILYSAFYNGGLRAVDISGELRGDLYRQGREIASWSPQDPEGFVPNAAFSWGVQPFGGEIFLSDWNSGLWALRLVDDAPGKIIGEPQ